MISCSSSKNFENNKNSEISINQNVIFNGNLKAEDGSKLQNVSIEFITLDKLFTSITDESGNFSIEIPQFYIHSKNIFVIEYTFLLGTTSKKTTRSQKLILDKNDLFLNKILTVSDRSYEIGAVVIVTPKPPDFYYLDGKKLS